MFCLLLLGDGWADCAEIWYAIGVPLVVVHAVSTGGVYQHVRTCTPRFCSSGTARPIVFQFPICSIVDQEAEPPPRNTTKPVTKVKQI